MAESSDAEKTSGAEILLPDEGWVLREWKCTEGSLVRKGETVALACPKDTSQSAIPSSTESSTSHKRPTRRRRIAPTGTAASNHETSISQRVVDPFANIQQRLAAKLSLEKPTTEMKENSAASLSGLVTLSPLSAPSSSPRIEETSITKKGVSTRPILAPSTGILRKAPVSTAECSKSSNNRIIGFVDACLHPAFLEGICVVCGDSMLRFNDNEHEMNERIPTKVPLPSFQSSEAVQKGSQVTVSGGVTMTVSVEESRRMAQQDTDRLLHHAKLSLVLDLDHTLVHATADPRARQFFQKEDVRTLRLPTMEGIQGALPPGTAPFMQHYAKLRPHIKTFLETVKADYELTVYTAGTRQYAEEITVVLCRHMVGSKNDIDDLERLRYGVHTARIEYQKMQRLHEETEKVDEDRTKGHNEGADEPPVKKRKTVSFVAPTTDSNGDEGGASQHFSGKSDHMTKEKLEALERELARAEELEKQAWDLRQKLFGSRVVSRTDVGDLGRDVKSLKRIFPCGGTMAAVIDDREDVWANASDNSVDTMKGEPPENLILVRPYHWQPFSGFADVNNASGEDLSGDQGGNGDGEDPSAEKDVQLIWTSRILKGLHRRFYRQEMDDRKSVPQLLVDMRKHVLDGVTIVLSGLVPLHKQALGVEEARPPFVRYAQSLGARVG